MTQAIAIPGIVDPATPGTPAPLTTLAANVSTAPAAGTIETWTFTAAPTSRGQKIAYPFLIGSEVCWDLTAGSGTSRTVLRGADGSSTATHSSGDQIWMVDCDELRAYQASPGGVQPHEHGVLAETCDPQVCSGQLQVTSKYIVVQRFWVPQTITVANMLVTVASASATLTSGQNLAGIYDSSGNLIAQTADQSGSWNSLGRKVMALTAQGSYTLTLAGGPGIWYWAAVLAVGTTTPKFANKVGNAANVNQPGYGASGYTGTVGSGAKHDGAAYESTSGGTRTSLVSLAGLQLTDWVGKIWCGFT